MEVAQADNWSENYKAVMSDIDAAMEGCEGASMKLRYGHVVVSHNCSECGAPVGRLYFRCPSCGATLVGYEERKVGDD